MATAMELTTTPRRMEMMEISRSVRSGAAASPWRKVRSANAERARDHAQRFEDADDSGRSDGSHADEAHVVAHDLRRSHLRDGNCGGIDSRVDVAAEVQIKGTSTKLVRTLPAQKTIALRKPIT